MSAGLVSLTIPAKVIRPAIPTTLYHVAERELGDALLWEKIADLNGLVDPFLDSLIELKIPARTGTPLRGGL